MAVEVQTERRAEKEEIEEETGKTNRENMTKRRRLSD